MANIEEEENDDAIGTLAGLLKGPLHKAHKVKNDTDDDRDDDDDDDDGEMAYNKGYMKKHMNRYMKENKGKGYMKKAEDFDRVSTAAQDEADKIEADIVVVEGTEMIKSFQDLALGLQKAFENLNKRFIGLEEQVAFSTEIQKASGSVLIKAQESIGNLSGLPQSVKGVVHPVNTQDNQNVSLLQKAQGIGFIKAKQSLLKAAKEGNERAGKVLTQVESCHGSWALLPDNAVKFIAELVPQRGN